MVSTITGIGRVLLGIVHTVVHVVCSIFSKNNREAHFEEAKLGVRNIGRGLIEAVPIVGNLAVRIIDAVRTNRFGAMAEKELEKNPAGDQVVVFVYGREMARGSLESRIFKITFKKPTSEDLPRVLLNNAV